MKTIYGVIPFENIVSSRWVANRLRKMDSAEKQKGKNIARRAAEPPDLSIAGFYALQYQ